MPTRGTPRPRRYQADRQAEVDAGQARLAELGAAAAEAEAEAAEKGEQLAALATEKELQAGGEVKELAARADELAKQCAPLQLRLHKTHISPMTAGRASQRARQAVRTLPYLS